MDRYSTLIQTAAFSFWDFLAKKVAGARNGVKVGIPTYNTTQHTNTKPVSYSYCRFGREEARRMCKSGAGILLGIPTS